jgi:hypothetical protein
MNLKCTKILLDKLKIDTKTIKTNLILDPNLNNWHINLLKFGRTNTLLLTHDKTLYSFFIGGYKADNFKNFDICIKEDIFKIMYSLNFQQKQIEVILQSMENLTYSKTDDKSVLSSMTQIKRFIESSVYRGDDIIDINKRINTIPLKVLEFATSNEKLIEFLNS